jgi:hypothetical protein
LVARRRHRPRPSIAIVHTTCEEPFVPGTFILPHGGRLDRLAQEAVRTSCSGVQYWSKRVSSYTSAGLRSKYFFASS